MDPLRVGDPGEVTWLGQFTATSYFWYALASAPNRTTAGVYTLGPTLITGATADRVWIGDSGTGEITVFDGAGKRVGRVTLPMPLRGFSDDALDRARKRAVESARDADDRARFEALYDKSIRPRTAPAFTRFVTGPDGEMWVELFEEDPAAARRFVIFDRAGRAVAGVVVPPAVKLHDVGPDHVLGVHTDDDGIERVVQYRLERT
ncbi:MAG TPA: hypothetical protein VJL28_11530 [Gemmatimonadaceae bacterium]|nr:hypothetical protein [Gemmatimonadaceae bacterium]